MPCDPNILYELVDPAEPERGWKLINVPEPINVTPVAVAAPTYRIHPNKYPFLVCMLPMLWCAWRALKFYDIIP